MDWKRRAVATVIVAAATAALLTASAPAARGPAVEPIRTVAAAKRYLAAQGIDPRTVVIQHATRNYAGPRCPGRGWSCTTAKRVLQMGSDQNQVDCTGSVLGDSCVVVQLGPGQNDARCVEQSHAAVVAQSCTITQTGTANNATVVQKVESNVTGDVGTQTANQIVQLTQTATLGDNAANVLQRAHQVVNGKGVQTQDAHQELTVTQTAVGTGSNHNATDQGQNQDAHNGAAQAQNTNPSGLTPCPAATLFFVGGDPNQCVYVTQNADAGDNANSSSQGIAESENSKAASAQTQGSFSGGIAGQMELQSATGQSSNSVHQRKDQDEIGGSTTSQTQIDPVRCCGVSAIGNSSSSETLDQSSSQDASTGGAAVQQLEELGFVHAPTGSCSVTQTARDNADSSSESASTQTCADGLGFATSCSTGETPELVPAADTVGACTSNPFSPFEIG